MEGVNELEQMMDCRRLCPILPMPQLVLHGQRGGISGVMPTDEVEVEDQWQQTPPLAADTDGDEAMEAAMPMP